MTPEEYFSLEALKPYVMDVVKKQIPVLAECMKEPGEIESLEGKTKYDAGDYVITGVQGEKYAVGKKYFEENYTPIFGELGQKGVCSQKPIPAKALILMIDMKVKVGDQDSTIKGRAGTPKRKPDILIKNGPGDYVVVAADIFDKTYDIVEPEHIKNKPNIIEATYKILFPGKTGPSLETSHKDTLQNIER